MISVPLISQALGNVEYKVARQIPFDDEVDLFVGEVLATHIRKGAMEGELYRADANPLLYMGTKYIAGKTSGQILHALEWHWTRRLRIAAIDKMPVTVEETDEEGGITA
jgi:hypothetical protein